MDQKLIEAQQAARWALVAGLKRNGIHDKGVLSALRRIPREVFLPAAYQHVAYDDIALPIAEDQTISQPFIVALMTQALALEGNEKILEIGTGSGYQTAVLAELARQVISLERLPSLAQTATALLAQLGYANAAVYVGDGTNGWPDGAPYEAVIVTAAAPKVPDPLIEQLAESGRLVIPVGSEHVQSLWLVIKSQGQLSRQDLGPVRFVPLIGQHGW